MVNEIIPNIANNKTRGVIPENQFQQFMLAQVPIIKLRNKLLVTLVKMKILLLQHASTIK